MGLSRLISSKMSFLGKKGEGANMMRTVLGGLDFQCEGCARKLKRVVRHLEGVERVRVDCDANQLIVTGNVDPSWLRESVQLLTKKKVELISPDGEEKKADEHLVVDAKELNLQEKLQKGREIIPDDNEEEEEDDDEEDEDDNEEEDEDDDEEDEDEDEEEDDNEEEEDDDEEEDEDDNKEEEEEEDEEDDEEEEDEDEDDNEEEEEDKDGNEEEEIDVVAAKEEDEEEEDDEEEDAVTTAKEAKPAKSGGQVKEAYDVNNSLFSPETHFAAAAMQMYNNLQQSYYANQDYHGFANHGYPAAAVGCPQTGFVLNYGPPPPPPPAPDMDYQFFSDENPIGCSLM